MVEQFYAISRFEKKFYTSNDSFNIKILNNFFFRLNRFLPDFERHVVRVTKPCSKVRQMNST